MSHSSFGIIESDIHFASGLPAGANGGSLRLIWMLRYSRITGNQIGDELAKMEIKIYLLN